MQTLLAINNWQIIFYLFIYILFLLSNFIFILLILKSIYLIFKLKKDPTKCLDFNEYIPLSIKNKIRNNKFLDDIEGLG